MQMKQKQIVDPSISDYIVWDKKCFNPDFYEIYNVDQTIRKVSETFAAIDISSIKITV